LVGKSGNRIYNASADSNPIMRLYVPQRNTDHSRISMHQGQSSIQMMTIKTQQGPSAQISDNVQAASMFANAKRERNARVSARFRARRKEKEREAMTVIASLELEVRNLREDVEFYRGQRDAMDKLLNTDSCRSFPRIESPRHQRPSSGGLLEARERACDAYDSADEATSDITSIYRTKSAAHFGQTTQSKDVDQMSRMHDDEHQKREVNVAEDSFTYSSNMIRTPPQTGPQNSKEVTTTLQDTSSPQSSLHSEPVTRPGISTHLLDRLTFGSSITLVAKGFRLCHITERSPRVVDGVISHECLEIAGWNRGLDVNDIPDRLWRTLVADRTDDGSNASSWWRRACMYCLSRTTTQYGDLNTSKLIANQSLPETVLQFLKRVQANVWNRRFFVGRNSQDNPDPMYGLGSRYIQSGDWCCILLGCSVPVILREQEKPFFKFIGECYVDGMMDGQAMDFMKDRNIVPMEFPLW
jgi:hypothetical protein